MSLTTDPNAPRGIPPLRRPPVRRLKPLPIFLLIAAIFLIMIALGWILYHGAERYGRVAGGKNTSNAADASATIAALHTNPDPPPRIPPPLPAQPAQTAVAEQAKPPGPSEMELEARKEAWDNYFKDLRAKRDRLASAEQGALGADQQATTVNAPGTGGSEASSGVSEVAQRTGLPGGASGGVGGSGGGNGSNGAVAGGGGGGRNFNGGDASSPGTDYLDNSVTLAVSRWELKAGDFIKCNSVKGVINAGKGTVKAMVSSNILDHATHSQIMIPQGSTLVGTYDPNQQNGEDRIPVAFTRVIFPAPGDESLDLGLMTAQDQSGYEGWKDQVDSHELHLLFNALILSAFAAGTQLSQPRGGTGLDGGYSSQQIIAGSLGQQLGEVGQAYAQKGLNVKPTLTIRPGYACTIQLTKDIAFNHPWHPSKGPVVAVSDDAGAPE